MSLINFQSIRNLRALYHVDIIFKNLNSKFAVMRIIYLINIFMDKMKQYIGLLICFIIIIGAISHVGFNYYNDILSFLFVAGGSVGYGFLKNQKDKFITNCGNGAIYFGWLGTLIGLIALTAGKWDNWGDIEKTGLALSVAMLTLLYGYIIKLITLVFRN